MLLCFQTVLLKSLQNFVSELQLTQNEFHLLCKIWIILSFQRLYIFVTNFKIQKHRFLIVNIQENTLKIKAYFSYFSI